MKLKFGPLSERELDIAEETMRRTLTLFADMAGRGASTVVLCEMFLNDSEMRQHLREKLERLETE